MPAGPGGRELTDFFAHIDGELAPADAAAPRKSERARLLADHQRALRVLTDTPGMTQ
jgi:hypothetical protein